MKYKKGYLTLMTNLLVLEHVHASLMRVLDTVPAEP